MGQPMFEVDLHGQPLQYLKQGKISGCGVRVIGFMPSTAAPTTLQGLDVSFNLHALGAGSIKGAFFEGRLDEAVAGTTPATQPISRIWLKAPGGDVTEPTDGRYYESPSDPQAIIYVTAVDSVIPLLKAVIDGEPLQVGVQRKGQDRDLVFSGVVELSAAQLSQLGTCIMDFLENLQQECQNKSARRAMTDPHADPHDGSAGSEKPLWCQDRESQYQL